MLRAARGGVRHMAGGGGARRRDAGRVPGEARGVASVTASDLRGEGMREECSGGSGPGAV